MPTAALDPAAEAEETPASMRCVRSGQGPATACRRYAAKPSAEPVAPARTSEPVRRFASDANWWSNVDRPSLRFGLVFVRYVASEAEEDRSLSG